MGWEGRDLIILSIQMQAFELISRFVCLFFSLRSQHSTRMLSEFQYRRGSKWADELSHADA